MKRQKKNHDLAEALSHLRDWCMIERKLTEDAGERKVWRDIEDWAKGASIKYRVEIFPLVASNINSSSQPVNIYPNQ